MNEIAPTDASTARSARAVLLIAATTLAGWALTGCMSWKAPWSEAGVLPSSSSDAHSATPGEAKRLTAVADDAVSLQRAIDAYLSVLTRDPSDVGALTAVADHSILMATAYTTRRDAKRRLYRRAQAYSELAMYTNPEFKVLVDGGKRPWEACHALGKTERRAMLTWMTAVLYNFKECMSPLARVANIRWIQRIEPFLQRLDELDPTWEDGAVPFNWGFYHFVLPGSLGGDRDKAAEEFARAVELGPDRLVYRWGRARFFRVRVKDEAGFRDDLEWVVSQDPSTAGDPSHWAIYVQRDARELLENVDRYF